MRLIMTETRQPFLKMHGAGNDFVVLDLRLLPLRVDAALARALADRQKGVGCDQVISLEPSERGDVFMRIHNPDGSEAQACGNGTRCVASLLFAESGRAEAVIETRAGLLPSRWTEEGLIEVEFLESGRKMNIDLTDFRDLYLQRIREYLDEIRIGCVNEGANYILVDTSTDLHDALLKRATS